jgi:hypothetical protein
MTRKILLMCAIAINAVNSSSAQTIQHQVCTVNNIHVNSGFYVQKIPLKNFEIPLFKISEEIYEQSSGNTPDSIINNATKPIISIGLERKKPYAFVSVPAYKKDKTTGTIQALKKFSLDITENEGASNSTLTPVKSTLRTTTTTSVLATGTWNKIAITQKGIYKIDYEFVKNKFGTSASGINSANIRLFGNGGTMLYEANYIPHPDDLVENAIEMHDGGDGIFGTGDYFLFYANGPIEWVKDSSKQLFHHRTNLYSDSSFYFISLDNGIGMRINNVNSTGTPDRTISTYNDYALHEKELENLGQFGKTWWGEILGFDGGLSNSLTVSFPVSNISDSIYFDYQLASAAIYPNYYPNAAQTTVTLNTNVIGIHNSYQVGGSDGDDPGRLVANQGWTTATGSSLDFTINYLKNVSLAKEYLDYIEINTRKKLIFNTGEQLSFRDWRSIGPSAIASYQLANANVNTQVWDITNPLQPIKINGTLSGSIYSFTQNANSLHEFIATDGSYYLTPNYAGSVANQNLHGLDQADYIIVANDALIGAANKLADFHRTQGNLKVIVAPTFQIYNEFSSGTQDIAAVRDFVKMFYDRAGNDITKMPKYLLLFGRASYDYKHILNTVPNAGVVPTYETAESLSATSGYCSDDFFAILDSNESITSYTSVPLMDIAVARIPATSSDEATAVVEKIIRYKSNQALGAWRINNVYAADIEDSGGDHMLDADYMATLVENMNRSYNSNKVYLDNMSIISTPSGARCPDANKAINDNNYKGTFLFNYNGHGSIYTLSSKRILTKDDFNAWNNPYKMPIMVTATCDFSRFDNPALQSAGEKLMLKSDGGAIALLTTTQVVYAGSNKLFNSAYLNAQYTKSSNGWYSFGDAFLISKNNSFTTADVDNTRKFALLGDPALIPDIPRYNVTTDSVQTINTGGVATITDSIKSLGTYAISGSVRDDVGNVMNGFNGKVNVTIFDKQQITPVFTVKYNSYTNIGYQNNIIYKGIATVNNGLFSFTFITPKDINYDFGKGKISYYADNGTIDASGSDTSTVVGGFADNVVADNDAPIVRPYMNDSMFVDGGITGTNSVLYAIITDNSGLNISGNSVGHDLTAILDNVIEAPYILNDYYETAPNTYKRGYVKFPITGLTDGKHTLSVKAWDVFNNSGEGVVNFEVVNGGIVRVQNLYNYPNPFRDLTHFVFEHNHPNEELTATIHIFNSSGALVRTLTQTFEATGSRSGDVIWDGTGNSGEKLFPGVYPYRIRIATATNIEDLGYQKVILLR